MRILRLPVLIGLSLLLLLLFAACGTTTTASGNGTSSAPTKTNSQEANEYSTPASKTNAAPTKTSESNEANEYATPAANKSAANTSASGSVMVKTATAMVKGKSETILTNEKGLTLYYFTADSNMTSACTSGCTSTWPPLLTSGSNNPASATTLPGKLTATTNGNGSQVQYNNHFLYTFAGDSAPGQTNGEGILGKWFVATTDLPAA